MKKKARKKLPQSEKKEHLVAVLLPGELLDALDLAVITRDSDRSKVIREALRKEFARAKGK